MPTPPVFQSTTTTDQPPLITIRIVEAMRSTGRGSLRASGDDFAVKLTIPGGDRAAFALAHRIAARVLERDEGGQEFEGHEVKIIRGTLLGRRPSCLVVEIEEPNQESASMTAEALVNAATEVARDAAGFATHRIERK